MGTVYSAPTVVKNLVKWVLLGKFSPISRTVKIYAHHAKNI